MTDQLRGLIRSQFDDFDEHSARYISGQSPWVDSPRAAMKFTVEELEFALAYIGLHVVDRDSLEGDKGVCVGLRCVDVCRHRANSEPSEFIVVVTVINRRVCDSVTVSNLTNIPRESTFCVNIHPDDDCTLRFYNEALRCVDAVSVYVDGV